MSRYLLAAIILVDQYYYTRDMILKEEGSQPYLSSTDLYEEGAFVLL